MAGRLLLAVACTAGAVVLAAVALTASGDATAGDALIAGVTTTPPSTDDGLPDLLIKQMRIELETGGSCAWTSTKLGTRVEFSNSGAADAGPFSVELNGEQQGVDGLGAGGSGALWFMGYVYPGKTLATVDVNDDVVESDESNNAVSQSVPIPTLPPTCTPTATPTAKPCPTDTAPLPGGGCGTITPTFTKTHTPTATDTPPKAPPGDADCDGERTSVDATVVLQLDAGLLKALDCGEAADVNGDEETDSEDALLILQYVAGLVDELPA